MDITTLLGVGSLGLILVLGMSAGELTAVLFNWHGLLIVIYGASQIASIFYSMSSATAPAWQRYMFMILPVAFIPVIVSFPTGLMLYWSTTNLWTVGQGFITRRLAPKPQPPPKRTSRAAPTPRDDGGAGDGAKPVKPAPKPAAPAAAGQQQRVRRRKKKGPQAGRRR
jgi:YidC/Oxa1 family membrane protein insertase